MARSTIPPQGYRDFGDEFSGRFREPEVPLPKNIGEYTVEELREMHKTLLQQDVLLERLTKAGIEYSRVIDFDGDNPVVASGAAIKVEVPDYDFINRYGEIKLGDWVFISKETKQITAKSDRLVTGEIVTISRVVDKNFVEIGGIMGSKLLMYPRGAHVEVGEEWVAASEFSILIRKIDRPVRKSVSDYKPVHWYEIGGLHDVKRELREAIDILRGSDSYAESLGIAQPKGLLLYGPPGNGKTMLGRAVATELASREGDYNSMAFIYIKGPEILSKFVGVSEERIRNLFLDARRHYDKHGVPAVIFIDECDAVMNARGSGRSSDVERTIVPAFLTEMDGIETSHAFIILATNRPDTLDPAIVREGRIDKHIEIGAPDRDAVYSILERQLEDLPCIGLPGEIAEAATSVLFGHRGLSGALVVSVVERAKRIAVRRTRDFTSFYDDEGNYTPAPQLAICAEDLIAATKECLR